MHRDTSVVRNGPRNIDLDIIFYDDLCINIKYENGLDIIIPHQRMEERDFVLGPMCDLCPEFKHPILNKTMRELLNKLPQNTLQKVLPLYSGQILRWGQKTYLMGILNITPDSFSDGGVLYRNIDKAVATAIEMVKNGADILDIGGQSSRPNAELISIDEELERIIPVIKKIKQQKELENIIISVDTFYAAVARKAIEAGANIVNDISGATFDPEMIATAAKLQVPIVLMHMRGTPKTMSSLTQYNDVVVDVANVLNEYCQTAQQRGIYRWNIILDVGIGFAKNEEQNLELLRRMKEFISRTNGLPNLLGTSRKKFIGKITGKIEPKDRVWGTSATISAGIAGGCDIVRVHDVAEMIDVVKMSDAIWRQNQKSCLKV
jgi:dihydropteroate synthase